MDDIEIEIVKTLKRIASDNWKKNLKSEKEWTSTIKEALGELGLKKGFSVCSTGKNENFSSEWLFDLIWYQEEEVEGINVLTKMPLIVESEWKRNLKDIKYDFEKLLVSNSERRLMICQSRPEKINYLKNYFRKAVKVYKNGNKGDRFLIAILDDYDTGEFQCELIEK